jgi:acyl dehydratase
MGLDPAAVGRRGRTTRISWDERDSALYALGIGAGRDPVDPIELPFALGRAAYPAMAMALAVAGGDRPAFGEYDRARLVHGGQELEVHAPLPVAGAAVLDCEIVAIEDAGRHGLVTWEVRAVGADDGAPLFTSRSTGLLIEGAVGAPPARPPRPAPSGPPSLELPLPTDPAQALLYRLSGDRNPLHSDPDVAARGGFPRPILHGLATLGAAVRLLTRGAEYHLVAVSTRFRAAVLPGSELTVRVWRDATAELRFDALDEDGRAVLDRGRALLR